jgi:GntR family transcriptional regulator
MKDADSNSPSSFMRRLGAERYAKSKWKVGNLVAFAADREASGRTWKPSDQIQTVRLVPSDAEVAEAFGIPVGRVVYERARVVEDQGIPTHSLISYYLREHVEGTPLVDPAPGPAGPGGGFAVLAERDLEPHHITETIHARMPTQDEISQLKLPVNDPVMILRRTTFTAENRIVEFARGVHVASKFLWSYSFTIPD